MNNSNARIFLNYDRAEVLQDGYRGFQCYPKKTGESSSFKQVETIFDESLGSGKPKHYYHNKPILFIPLVGDIVASIDGIERVCSPGCYFLASENVVIQNPYPNEVVNFLAVVYRDLSLNANCTFDFNIEDKNLLHSVKIGQTQLLIGQFDGRRKCVFKAKLKFQAFGYVLGGAFEVEDRLLHERDGLWLHDINLIDFEALSTNAIIIFFLEGI